MSTATSLTSVWTSHNTAQWPLPVSSRRYRLSSSVSAVTCMTASKSVTASLSRGWMSQTRSSATAERQRVSYTRLSRLTHWSCTSLNTASVLQLHNRLAKLVSTLSANKPCDIRTLSWIGHSRSFRVILIGAGRNPEWCVVLMCN